MASSEWDNFPVIAAAGAAAFVGVSLAYLAWSASRPASSVPVPVLGGSRGVDAGDVSSEVWSVPSEVVSQIMNELWPLHNVYLDVADALHEVFEARSYTISPTIVSEEIDHAKRWLNDYALWDLVKAYSAGYINPIEYDNVVNQIRGVIEDLNSKRLDDALRTLSDLESWFREKLYRWVRVQFKLKGF